MRWHSAFIISKHLLIVFQVLLVSITKSDEQSPPRYATNPLSQGQETLRIALARTITPTLAPPHADDHQSIPRTPAEPPRRPGSPRPGPPAPSRSARALSAPATPVTPSHQDPSAPSPSIMTPPLMTFTPRVLPGTYTQRTQAKRVSTPHAKRNQEPEPRT